jgi:uncharacterized coiled-coil protein SlyX
MSRLHALLIPGVVSAAMIAVVSGQGARPSQTPTDPTTDLLAEVRGLRVELNQAVGTSMRMQLLVARLALQEGRINTLGSQLTNVRQQLVTAQLALGPVMEQVKRAQETGKEIDENLKPLVEMMQRSEQGLRNQEAELAGLVSTEQGRWADFNARIDELERSLPVGGPR